MTDENPRESPAGPDDSATDAELTDEELESVVGGLTRPWMEPPPSWDPTLRVP